MEEVFELQSDIAKQISFNKEKIEKSNKPLKIKKLLNNIYKTSRFLNGIVNLLEDKDSYNYTLSFVDSGKNGSSYVTVQAKGLA